MKKKRVPVDTELEVVETAPVAEETVATEAPVAETAVETEEVAVATEATEETAVATEEVAEAPVCEKKKCKFSIFNIFAIVLTVLPLILACVIKSNVLVASNKVVQATILTAVLATFKIGAPSIAAYTSGTLGFLNMISMALVAVAMVTSVVMMIVTLIAPKTAKTLSRVIALVNFCAYLVVTLLVMCTTEYTTMRTKMNWIAFAIGAICGLAYIALAFLALKKKAIVPTLACFFSSLIALCYVFGMVYFNRKDTAIIMKASTLHAAMYLTMLTLVGAVFLFSLLRMMLVKAKVLDLICFALNALMAVGVIVFGAFVVDNMKTLVPYVLIALVISAIQVFMSTVSFKKEVKEKKAAIAQLAAEEETAETTAEETAEPEAPVVEETPCECECVCEEVATEETATEEVVEEVIAAPVEEVSAPEVAATEETEEVLEAEPVTAEVPVENLPVVDPICNKKAPVEDYAPRFKSAYMLEKQAAAAAPATVAFDWFLESLTSEEKQEFTELFVYKYLGGTAVLPDYVPGGNNYDFFRAFFVNLGKYRNRISDTLLEKMYQYMIKKY